MIENRSTLGPQLGSGLGVFQSEAFRTKETELYFGAIGLGSGLGEEKSPRGEIEGFSVGFVSAGNRILLLGRAEGCDTGMPGFSPLLDVHAVSKSNQLIFFNMTPIVTNSDNICQNCKIAVLPERLIPLVWGT